MDEITIVVPCLDKNSYSNKGDLVEFGDTTLLEWKLQQLLNIFPENKIVVFTPSQKIIKIVQKIGVCCIKRKDTDRYVESLKNLAGQLTTRLILVAPVTGPFLDGKDYLNMIDALKKQSKYTGLATASECREYIYHKKSPVNFVEKELTSRHNIIDTKILTNGCFIVERDYLQKYGSFICQNPYLYILKSPQNLEIKDHIDFRMIHLYLESYFFG